MSSYRRVIPSAFVAAFSYRVPVSQGERFDFYLNLIELERGENIELLIFLLLLK